MLTRAAAAAAARAFFVGDRFRPALDVVNTGFSSTALRSVALALPRPPRLRGDDDDDAAAAAAADVVVAADGAVVVVVVDTNVVASSGPLKALNDRIVAKSSPRSPAIDTASVAESMLVYDSVDSSELTDVYDDVDSKRGGGMTPASSPLAAPQRSDERQGVVKTSGTVTSSATSVSQGLDTNCDHEECRRRRSVPR